MTNNVISKNIAVVDEEPTERDILFDFVEQAERTMASVASYPQNVQQLTSRLNDITVKLDDFKVVSEAFKAGIAETVWADNRYTNESSRKTAVALVLDDDKSYQGLMANIKDLSKQRDAIQNLMTFEQNNMKVAQLKTTLLSSIISSF